MKKTKVLFVHIAKAAGSSVNKFFQDEFGIENCASHLESSSEWRDDEKRSLLLEEKKFISGHLTLKEFKTKLNLDDYLSFSFVRDPKLHILSHISWVRKLAEPSEHKRFAQHDEQIQNLARKLSETDLSKAENISSLIENLTPYEFNLFDNAQTRYLRTRVGVSYVTESDVKDALENINSLNFIGLVEEIETDFPVLVKFIGVNSKIKLSRENAQSVKYGLDINNESHLAALMPLIKYDISLYENIKFSRLGFKKTPCQAFFNRSDDLLASEEKPPLDISDPRIVDVLRNEAIRIEESSLDSSIFLMQAARYLRPQGPVINKKLENYGYLIKKQKKPEISISWDFSSLIRSGKPYCSRILGPGWREKMIINLGCYLKVLIIQHEDGGDSAWYFDAESSSYIGNDISKIDLSYGSRDVLTGLVLERLFNELYEKCEPPIFSSLIKEKGFFYNQIQILSSNINIRYSSDNLSDAEKNIMKQLIIPGRDVQDMYISANIHAPIVELNIRGDTYATSHGLILNDFTIVYPCKSDSGNVVLLFESGHYCHRFALLDCAEGKCYVQNKSTIGLPNDIRDQVRMLIEHIADYYDLVTGYLTSRITNKSGILMGIRHIGHNLWNNLTAISRLDSNKRRDELNEVVLWGGDEVELWIRYSDLSPSTYFKNVYSRKSLINRVYRGNAFPVRLGDDFISRDLVEKIACHADYACNKEFVKLENETRVIIGLRFENRTWLNQKEGIVEVVKYLASKFEKLSVVIDGHDAIPSLGSMIKHPIENNSKDTDQEVSLIDLERDVADTLIREFKGLNVKIFSAVGETVHCTLKLIRTADFFIAPWGAGLAKYKWFANLPGVILTSRWNMNNRGDLKIYEDVRYREGATPCIYVAQEYIEDKDCSTNLYKAPQPPQSLADFIVDVEGIKRAIDEVLMQTEN